MALSLGLDVARSSLAATAEQISVVSRNVSLVGNSDAIRKLAPVVTGAGGLVNVAGIVRNDNALLLDKFMMANSSAEAGGALAAALDKLSAALDATDQERSPGALIGKLLNALQVYSASPQNISAASAVVSVAKTLAAALNESSATVQGVRRQADADIAGSVGNVNSLLEQFRGLNNEIVDGTRRGRDITDALDARDRVVKSLSSEIGIRTLVRADGDMALFTESGVTMFDKVARPVTFNATNLLASGQIGASVFVDGVPVSGTPQVMAVHSGKIAGLVAVRDQLAPAYERKLDEIARGLIESFAEVDNSAVPTLPPAAGLFTYPGAPAVPTSGVIVNGLSSVIAVNATVDPMVGGQPLRLRDGAISSPGNPAYTYNASGSASYTDRIQQLISELTAARSFDPAAGLEVTTSVSSFATGAASALEEQRQSLRTEAEFQQVVSDRAASILSKETGVNLDEEMANMLNLERSYQASARLMSSIDSMLTTLLDAMR